MDQRAELERLLAEEEALLAELEAQQGAPAAPGMLEGLNLRDRLPSTAQAHQQSLAMGGEATRQAGEHLQTSGTHYRQLGRAAGLPLDPPTPEDQAAYEQAVIEGGAIVGGNVLGKALWQPVSAIAKYLGRGARPAWKAEQMVAAAGKHAVPAGSAKAATVPGELGKATLAGSAVDVAQELTPGEDVAHEWLENVAAAGTGLAYMGIRGTENLMVRNPSYRARVMSPGGGGAGGVVAGVLGSLTALGAAQGVPWLRQFLADVLADTEPEQPPARGEAMMGPVGGAAAPMDEQGAIARQLLR